MSLFQDCPMRLIYCEIGTKMTLNNFDKQDCWKISSYLMNNFFRDLKKRKNDVCRMTLNDNDAEKKSQRIDAGMRKFLKCVWEGAEYDHMWS